MAPRSRLLIAALLVTSVAVTATTFRGTLGNSFVNWDDDRYIYDNPHIRSFSAANLRWMLTSTSPAYWHPVTWLAHGIDHAAGGLDPRWHHLSSLVLHALNVGWVFLLILALLRSTTANALWAGLVAALLFGLHPLRVEPVAWAADKKELLCAFFALPAVVAYLRYGWASAARARRAWYVAALLLYMLALASKPMAVALPAVLLLLDAFPLRRLQRAPRPLARLIAEKLPFVALAGAVGAVTVFAQHRAGALVHAGELTLFDRVLVAVRGLVFYVEKTAWPANLVPFYPLPTELVLAPYILCAAVLAAITALAVGRWRAGEPWWLVGWLCYVVLVLPVSGLVQVGSQAAADRFSYLPTVSLFVLLGGCLSRLADRALRASRPMVIRGLLRLSPLLLVVPLAGLTTRQVRVWHDSQSLWLHVVRAFPGRVVQAHHNLGALYHQQGDLDRAAVEYRRALAIFPRHAGAHNNLGLIFAVRGRYQQAEQELLRALAIDPHHGNAHANLARLYLTMQRFALAARHLALAAQNGAPLPRPIVDAIARARRDRRF